MKNENTVIGRDGVVMPKIIYGTAWKKGRTADLVELALKQGFRGIDTACQPKHYNEAGVGTGIARCLNDTLTRADLYLQSKFTPIDGQDPNRIPYNTRLKLPDQVAESCAVSLKNLQTDYLDGLILHSPLMNLENTLTAWRGMEALVDKGLVKQIGLSNCYDPDYFSQLFQQARIKPAVLQNRFYAATGYDQALRAFCREQNIYYQSFWTLSANEALLLHPSLESIASRHQRTTEQIFFRFLTLQSIIPLTGTSSAQHMAEDLDIFSIELNPLEVMAIEALLDA